MSWVVVQGRVLKTVQEQKGGVSDTHTVKLRRLRSNSAVWLFRAGFWKLAPFSGKAGVWQLLRGTLHVLPCMAGFCTLFRSESVVLLCRAGFGRLVRSKLAMLLCRAGFWKQLKVNLTRLAAQGGVLETAESQA